MDHVIGDLQRWLEIFKESEPDNKRAHQAIEKALDELYKYQYPGYSNNFRPGTQDYSKILLNGLGIQT